MHTSTEDAFYLEELRATSPQPSFRPLGPMDPIHDAGAGAGPAYFSPRLRDVAHSNDSSLYQYITTPGPRPAAQHSMNTSSASTDASDSPDRFHLRAGSRAWASAPDLTTENFFQPHLNSPRPHLWDNDSPLAGLRFLPKHSDSNVHVSLPSRKAAHVSRIERMLTNIAEELAWVLTEECKHNCVTGCVSCFRAFQTTFGGVGDHVGKTQFSSPRNSHAPRSPGR
jgi:hypothetical protein